MRFGTCAVAVALATFAVTQRPGLTGSLLRVAP
jgi:tRNA A37 threonylcarbamoyltransferase TsaD